LNPARHISENPYDMIITSETLYTPSVIHNLYNNLLKLLSYPHGKCYVAAKTVYFGCGGGTLGFKQLIDQDRKLNYKAVYEVEGGVKREILLVQWNN
jgi:protein-histidine N-methyltransferase